MLAITNDDSRTSNILVSAETLGSWNSALDGIRNRGSCHLMDGSTTSAAIGEA